MAFLDTSKISEEYNRSESLWGLDANKYVKKIPDLIGSGAVLDIGVGEGRNALFLARNGFDVTGIDISKEGIDKFLNFAGNEGLNVRGIVCDAADFEFEKAYDVVMCVATLHLIRKDRILDLIKDMKKNTKVGGINLITVFTKKDAGSLEYPNLYFFGENELKGLYSDWNILEFDNYTKEESHGKPHSHHICVIIARK